MNNVNLVTKNEIVEKYPFMSRHLPEEKDTATIIFCRSEKRRKDSHMIYFKMRGYRWADFEAFDTNGNITFLPRFVGQSFDHIRYMIFDHFGKGFNIYVFE